MRDNLLETWGGGITQGSSETTREAYILKDNLFKFWFIGFLEGKGYFLINKNGNL